MSNLQKLIRTATAPVRGAQDAIAGAISSLRQQVPGARMVGEFAVKIGLKEIGRRISGGKKPG